MTTLTRINEALHEAGFSATLQHASIGGGFYFVRAAETDSAMSGVFGRERRKLETTRALYVRNPPGTPDSLRLITKTSEFTIEGWVDLYRQQVAANGFV
jgi:hypothetical protein